MILHLCMQGRRDGCANCATAHDRVHTEDSVDILFDLLCLEIYLYNELLICPGGKIQSTNPPGAEKPTPGPKDLDDEGSH